VCQCYLCHHRELTLPEKQIKETVENFSWAQTVKNPMAFFLQT
jgi:hypothetical protein